MDTFFDIVYDCTSAIMQVALLLNWFGNSVGNSNIRDVSINKIIIVIHGPVFHVFVTNDVKGLHVHYRIISYRKNSSYPPLPQNDAYIFY